MAENQCSEKVQDKVSRNFNPCQKPASYEHGNRLYCGQHYPPAIKNRQDKSYEKWREKHDAEWAIIDHQRDCAKAIDEAGITRPEGLKEVVEMCDRRSKKLAQDKHEKTERGFAKCVLQMLSVAPKPAE